MVGFTRTLPTFVRVSLDERNARKQLAEVLHQANQGYTALLGMESDLGVIPQRLEDINVDWLGSLISCKVEAIKALPLPQATIQSMLAQWNTIKENAAKAITPIQSLFEIVPQLNCSVVGDKIVCSNVEDWVTAKATYAIPAKYKEHYRLVGNVIEAVNKLRYYETHNGLKSFPVDMLINSINSVDDYTRFIVNGSFEQEMSQEQFNRVYNYELSRL